MILDHLTDMRTLLAASTTFQYMVTTQLVGYQTPEDYIYLYEVDRPSVNCFAIITDPEQGALNLERQQVGLGAVSFGGQRGVEFRILQVASAFTEAASTQFLTDVGNVIDECLLLAGKQDYLRVDAVQKVNPSQDFRYRWREDRGGVGVVGYQVAFIFSQRWM